MSLISPLASYPQACLCRSSSIVCVSLQPKNIHEECINILESPSCFLFNEQVLYFLLINCSLLKIDSKVITPQAQEGPALLILKPRRSKCYLLGTQNTYDRTIIMHAPKLNLTKLFCRLCLLDISSKFSFPVVEHVTRQIPTISPQSMCLTTQENQRQRACVVTTRSRTHT
jgi:hypothetical protein